MAQSLEEMFGRARKDASFRQSFLDTIDADELRAHVSGIRYQTSNGDGSFMWVENYCAPGKPAIYVTRRAFFDSEIQTVGDLLSALIDHEGTHVLNGHCDLLRTGFWGSTYIDERDAYRFQLRQMKHRAVSPGFRSLVERQLGNYQAKVRAFKIQRPMAQASYS